MVFAHIFGIPVEETALTFAPVILVVIAGARISSHRRHQEGGPDSLLVLSRGRVLRQHAPAGAPSGWVRPHRPASARPAVRAGAGRWDVRRLGGRKPPTARTRRSSRPPP